MDPMGFPIEALVQTNKMEKRPEIEEKERRYSQNSKRPFICELLSP